MITTEKHFLRNITYTQSFQNKILSTLFQINQLNVILGKLTCKKKIE